MAMHHKSSEHNARDDWAWRAQRGKEHLLFLAVAGKRKGRAEDGSGSDKH